MVAAKQLLRGKFDRPRLSNFACPSAANEAAARIQLPAVLLASACIQRRIRLYCGIVDEVKD
jgi:hypothetical protein